MNSDAQGLFLVTACLMQSLFAMLGKKGLISEPEGADVIRAAERFLGGLSSEMMSEDARDYANRVLQQMGKTLGSGPD
jgi:hypothetical protein